MNLSWWILSCIAALLLIFYWKGRNSIWGTTTIAAFIGVIIAVINYVITKKFTGWYIWKAAVLGAIMGFLFELFGKVGDYYKNKRNQNT